MLKRESYKQYTTVGQILDLNFYKRKKIFYIVLLSFVKIFLVISDQFVRDIIDEEYQKNITTEYHNQTHNGINETH